MRILLAAVLAALAASPAFAALPAAPFDFTMSPAAVTEGAPVTIRIAPVRAGAGAPQAHDLYLALARSEEAAFLTEGGAWSPRPVPFARAVPPDAAPIVRQWPRAWPPGEHAFALIAVPVSTDPLARTAWRYRPAIRWLEVTPRVSDKGIPDYTALVTLALATAGANAAVWWTLLQRRRGAS